MEASVKSRYAVLMCALSAANLGSLLAASSLLLPLQPEDRISIPRGTALTLLGFVHFTSLFELLNALALTTAAGRRIRHKYQLSCGDVLDINNKVVSAVQALQCCGTGALVCAHSCSRDFLRTSHFMSDAYAWFGAAYFFYDIWSMYLVYVYYKTKQEYFEVDSKYSGVASSGDSVSETNPGGEAAVVRPTFFQYIFYEPMILFHHIFIGGFGFLVIVYLRGGLGDCVFGVCYLMEASTPLVSLRGILSRMKLKDSSIYLVNGLAMVVTFFVCRVLSLPYVMLMYARVINTGYFEAMKTLPTGCKISISLLMVPQLYWFYLMSSGAVKVFIGKGKSKTKTGALKTEPSIGKITTQNTATSDGDAGKQKRS